MLAWTQALTTGTFALAGVVIGAALGAVLQYELQRRVERRAYRQARRLITEELFETLIHISHLVGRERYPQNMGSETSPFMPIAAWEAYRDVVALEGSEKEFTLMSRVYASLRALREEITGATPGAAVPSDLLAAAREAGSLGAFVFRHLTGRDWETWLTAPASGEGEA